MQCSAVGGGDQHGRNLRVVADLFFQRFEVEPLRVQAALDGLLHIGQQRTAIGRGPASFEKTRQGHARLQRRHRTGDVFTDLEQQLLQAMTQGVHVQGLAQVSRRCERQGFAHAGAVAAITHENERQRRLTLLGAHIAQQIQAITARQFTRGNDQVRLARQRRQRLGAIGTDLHPCIATHAEQHLAEHLPYPRVAFGNQHTRCCRWVGSAHTRLSDNSRHAVPRTFLGVSLLATLAVLHSCSRKKTRRSGFFFYCVTVYASSAKHSSMIARPLSSCSSGEVSGTRIRRTLP
ncbi:hypothetical protein D3C76_1142220 [compost metagenome]